MLNERSTDTFSPPPLTPAGRYAALQGEFSSAVQTSAEQKALILKLEHDLSTIQAMSSLPRPDADGSELSGLSNIPEPIKEATAMFTSTSPTQHCVFNTHLRFNVVDFFSTDLVFKSVLKITDFFFFHQLTR